MKRRTLLKLSGALMPASAWTQENVDKPCVLVVMLRGGADGLNMLVPYNDTYYYEARPSIAIDKAKCLPINDTFGLNPCLSKSFWQMYRDNHAVFIPASGQADNSRSHFLAQDLMEYGVNQQSAVRTGFLSRLQMVLNMVDKKSFKSLSFTSDVCPIFNNPALTTPTFALEDVTQGVELSNQEAYESSESSPIKEMLFNHRDLNEIRKNLTPSAYRLAKVAQVMRMSNYNVGFVDFQNWDTHAKQGSLNGEFSKLLTNLDEELHALRLFVGERKWKTTLVIVMSEFGRTFKENGHGTDHGHGNLLSLFGGIFSKSMVAGNWLELRQENLHEQRDLPVFHDYREVLAEVFIKLYGFNPSQLEYIFPGYKPSQLNII